MKKLARLVVRGFYSVETVIVVDMLIRNPCMKEDDLVELLKFERKQLRAIIATLKNDKFIRVKLKMETGLDGKATRQNYYYINYKIFVNVVKYKLDHMRRKIELEERDSTSRSSFKCPACLKTFTDLEVNELFDVASGEFRCTFCNATVDEDESAAPKQDSRLVQAKFNDQTEPLYNLLQEIEGVVLAPELLEPEPTDLTDVKRAAMPCKGNRNAIGGDHPGSSNTGWSGDATRSRHFGGAEQDVSISFGDDNANEAAAAIAQAKKERPVWMVESTVETVPNAIIDDVLDDASSSAFPSIISIPEDPTPPKFPPPSRNHQDDIMAVLLAHEKNALSTTTQTPFIPGGVENDGFGMDAETNYATVDDVDLGAGVDEDDEDDDDDDVPMVTVGDQRILLHEVTGEIVARMTPSEKDAYIKLGQEVYSNIYD